MADKNSVLYKNVDKKRLGTRYYLYPTIQTVMICVHGRPDRILFRVSNRNCELIKKFTTYVAGGGKMRLKKKNQPVEKQAGHGVSAMEQLTATGEHGESITHAKKNTQL